MPAPRVSIVVPALNAADWIDATLTSVVAQTYPHDALEVIVVDDGSSDGTSDIAARRLGESGLDHQIIRRERTGGPGRARNDGWRRAAGSWVQCLDADDLIAPDKIAVQMRGAMDAPQEVAVVVSCWSSLVEHEGGWQPAKAIVDPQIGDDPLIGVLRADNFVATGSQLFRREWLERVGGYDPEHRLVEDVNLLIRMVAAGGRFLHVPSDVPLFWYRRRTGSLSGSDSRGFVEARVRNARVAELAWTHADALTPERRQFLADLYASAVRSLSVEDPEAFEIMADHIGRLQPAFVPSEPPAVRRLARVVGYRRAERTAGRYRQIKSLVTRKS